MINKNIILFLLLFNNFFPFIFQTIVIMFRKLFHFVLSVFILLNFIFNLLRSIWYTFCALFLIWHSLISYIICSNCWSCCRKQLTCISYFIWRKRISCHICWGHWHCYWIIITHILAIFPKEILRALFFILFINLFFNCCFFFSQCWSNLQQKTNMLDFWIWGNFA